MRKHKIMGKIFGIILVLAVVVSMFGGLAGIVNSAQPANGLEIVSPSSGLANVTDTSEPPSVDADKGGESSLQVLEPAQEGYPREASGKESACENCSRAEQEIDIGMRNPAAVYCEEMGYEYKVVKTKDGERGICVLPNGNEVDAWAFYRGECGKNFSYCAKKGWSVAPVTKRDSFATNCTTCLLPDGSSKTVSELLNLSQKCTIKAESFSNVGDNEGNITLTVEMESSLPDNFDWRNKDGQDWMTPVKNQGSCGSCWAFSAVGIVEPAYNIFSGDPNLDLDLSEQYLVSDCCEQCGNCGGGGHSTALEFTRDEGISDEDCFPYTATDCPCSDRCDNWSSRLKTIDETEYVPSDIQTIKEYLIQNGPLSVAMGIGDYFGGYYDGDGIYRCSNDDGTNHAVVIAGYNETENYWIVRNSWGTGYQDGGYFKVGCGECAIERYVRYAALYEWPLLLSPANGLTVRPGETNFTWKEKANATGYHIQIDQVDTFDSGVLIEANTTEPQYTANLSIGSYYWRVKARFNGEDSPYSPVWRLSVVDKPVVQVTTDPDEDGLPAITQTADGKVWVVWESYRSGNADIWYKTSPDGGATWSDASQITTDTDWNEYPAIAQTADGKVWVVWHSWRSGNYDIWYKTSSDGGATWSEASQITTDPEADGLPAITQTADGKVWVVWESYRSGNADIWYKTSPDGGATWSDASQITTDTDWDEYPAIAQTADGKVWVVWQSYRSGGNGIWCKTSPDGGATWSEASPIDTGIWGYDPAITQTNDGKIWVTFYSYESGNYDIWYTTSSDNGSTWSSAYQFTRFVGYDLYPAVADLSSGKLALAWMSDRAVNFDIWYGVIGSMEDINPPPYLYWAENEPETPSAEEDIVTVRAEASDESGIAGLQLVWWIDGSPQGNLTMYDDGIHNDYGAGDSVYGVQIGPFPLIGTVVEYQIQITDIDGNVIVAPQYRYSFEVIKPFAKTADILLVSDQGSWVIPYYSDALDNLGYAYDVWDSGLRGNIDGETLNQYSDGVVIWSTPDWGYIDYSETQDNLSSYLDNGGKLFISGQDIGYGIGSSDFYRDYLHAQYVQDNIDLYGLFGVTGDPITDGLYVSISGGDGANNQAWPSEIDPISPAVSIFNYDPSATTALVEPSIPEEEMIRPESEEMLPQWEPMAGSKEGVPWDTSRVERSMDTNTILSSGTGALRVDAGTYKVVYFAFGFEAINSVSDRADTMERVMDWLAPDLVPPVLVSPADGSLSKPGDIIFTWGEKTGATGYHIQIDQVDTFDSGVLIEADPTEPQYTANLSTGSYYWRVKAHLGGEDSPYSPTWHFSVAEPVVQVTTDPGSDYDPSIAQTDDGKVWVVWRSYRSGNSDIWYKTSSDGGATWSNASPIDTGIWGYDPAIIQTNDGKIWVTFYSYKSGSDDIWYTTSSDGGANWSTASQVTTDPEWDLYPAIAQTDDGKVWVVWQSYRSGNSDIWYKTSSDGGSTWSSASQITTYTGSDYEPAITQTEDGKVWVVWQSYRSGGNGIWCKTSPDGGATWSEAFPISIGTWGYDPAITQTNDGKIWVTFYSHESGNGDIWYTTSSDGGANWSSAYQFTRFVGWDECPAATALSSGKLAVAWRSDRAVNYDIWYGVIGSMEDINPPPYLDWAGNEPRGPDTSQTVTVRAEATDETGLQDVQLVWWVDSSPQSNRTMYDDGNHDDYSAGDGVYGVELGPFPVIGAVVEYQVQITDIDNNTVLAPQYPYSFEVIKPFIKTADILLVSDQDSWVIPYYSDALDNLGYPYDVWDSGLRGSIDGGMLNQYVDGVVIWTTPYWGYIDYSETQDNLTSYLDNGGKLFISGQFIGYSIGSSDFYQDYLHAQYVQGHIDLYGLFGVPDDPITDGLYINISGGDGANNQYYPSEIDPIAPAVTIFTYDPTATTALVEPIMLEEERQRPRSDEMRPDQQPMEREGRGVPWDGPWAERSIGTKSIESSGTGALRVDTGVYKVVYFAFGFEAINSVNDRADTMERVMDWLAPDLVPPVLVSPADGSLSKPGNITFTWKEKTGATGYHIQIDQVDTFDSGVLIEADPTEPQYTANLSTGSYYWRVKAHLDVEDSPYSPTWRFSVAEPVVQVTWVYNCSYANPGGYTEQDTNELNVTMVGEEAIGGEDAYKLSGVFVPVATRDAADMPLTLHIETAEIWTSKAHMEYLKMSSAIAELPGLPSTVTWTYAGDYGWPYEVGETWSSSVRVVAGPLDIITELENKVLGMETITVPAGTFDCYHIVAYDPASPDTYTYEHWFNATVVKSDVKMIDRFLWAGVEVRELVSYSLGTPPVQYNLTISSTSGGSVTTPGEGTFGPYDPGEVVNLVAGAEPNYHFINWTGDTDTIADVNSRRTTIIMNGDYSITANFAEGAIEVDSEWGKVDTPYREDWTIAPNSDILVPASIPGGEVIYVIGGGHEDNNLDNDYGPRLWKSEDSGVTWDDLADEVWKADSLPEGFKNTTLVNNGDITFNYVACGKDDSDFVAVAIVNTSAATGSTDFCNMAQAVVISNDGGNKFYWTRDVTDSSANATLNCVFDMKVSDEDTHGRRNIALGGVGTVNTTCPTGLVFRYRTGGLVGGHWVEASAYDGWDDDGGITSVAVTKVVFAPSWLADKTVLVVSHSTTNTYLQTGTWGNKKVWNEPAGFEPAVLIVADASMWPTFKGAAAGLALPMDYEGRNASARYAWVYVDRTDGNGTIYRVKNGTVIEVAQQISGNPHLASISYLGTIDEGKAIAGLLGDGTGYPTGCCEGVQVYRNDGIADMNICCDAWKAACKPPTGTMAAMVLYVAPNKAYAFVGGTGEPFEEGAVSGSLDDGDTWNQGGLVDTYVNYLSDVAKSADCSKTWVVSVNTEEDGVCDCDSVWLKASWLPEAPEYSGAWIREWCDHLTPNAALNSAQTPEIGLLRVPEQALSVYLVDRGTDTVYYDGNEGLGCWKRGWSTVDEISDLAVRDEATIYAVGFNGDVAVSDDHGFSASWSSTMDSKVDEGHTIAVFSEGNVLVGGDDGKVSYSDDDLATFLDGDASFTELGDIGDGRVHVAFDSYFDTNDVIYAAVSVVGVDNMSYETPVNDPDNGIYRWVIGESSKWKDLGEYTGTATPYAAQLGYDTCTPVEVGYYGIVLSNADGNPETDATTGGVLYVPFYDADGNITGVARCLNPAEEVACGEALWDYLIEDTADNHGAFTLEPSSLKICGCLTPDANSRLWAIDDNWYYDYFATDEEDSDVGRLWTYEDCYAKSGTVLVAPADGAVVGCDPHYWWNDAFALKWERQCDACSYNLQISLNEDFTGLVLDISGKDGDCQEMDYEPTSGSNPSYLVAEGALGPGSCGTTFYWRVRSADAETGEIIHSPWSEARSFTVGGGALAPVWSVGDNWVYNCSYENPEGTPKYGSSELNVTVVAEVPAGEEEDVNEDSYKLSGVFDPPATRDAADMPLTLHIETADIWNSKDHMEYLKTSSAIAELPGLPSTVTWTYPGDYGWPYEVGKTWSGSVRVVAGPLDEITEMEFKVLGVETITVPAGTFECYHIVTYEPTSPDNYTFEHWFNADAVKSVVKVIDRFLWAGVETRELTSYSVQYKLTINSTSGGNVTIPGEGTFTHNASEVVDLVATPDTGYQFVKWSGDVGTIANVNAASTNITMNGDYSITANFVSKSRPGGGGGGGGGGGAPCYLDIDMLGKITRVRISCATSRTLKSAVAPDFNNTHFLEIDYGTTVICNELGEAPEALMMRVANQSPPVPDGSALVGAAYDFTGNYGSEMLKCCSGVTFGKNITIALNYDPNELPESTASLAVAYYDAEQGIWVSVPPDIGRVAEVGKATGLMNHFSTVAVIAELAPAVTPASFVWSALNIEQSPQVWKNIFVGVTGEDVTITANVANNGGQEGTYIAELKLNGERIDAKEVTLAAGQSQQVRFTLSGMDYGQYEVEVAGLSGEFTVSRIIDWWAILGIILGVGLITWAVIWGRRRWKKRLQLARSE